jgi:hypothetical protein
MSRLPFSGPSVWTFNSISKLPAEKRSALESRLDELGERSAKAQGLGHVITSISKLRHTDQRVYIWSEEGEASGILKVGKKKLFLRVWISLTRIDADRMN